MKTKKLLLTATATMSLAVATMAQNVPNYVPTNGLMGWWPFNGNANDESGNNNNGTVNGATLTADRFANINSAYYFDGITANITTTANFNPGGLEKSFSIWVKMANLNDRGWMISPNTCVNSTNLNSFGLFLDGLGNVLFYGMGTGDVTIPYSYNINQFYHFVSTFKNDTVRNYINSNLINTSVRVLNTTSNGILFGDRFTNTLTGSCGLDNTTGGLFTGTLDDIGVWNRTLTQQEITNLYNGGICYQSVTVTDTLRINTTITGFNPVTYQNSIKIWPNPTKDHITIDNGNIANLNGHQIKISNALGQQVFQSAITQKQFYVDMSSWGGHGIYFVNIINAQGVTIETKKIVLE